MPTPAASMPRVVTTTGKPETIIVIARTRVLPEPHHRHDPTLRGQPLAPFATAPKHALLAPLLSGAVIPDMGRILIATMMVWGASLIAAGRLQTCTMGFPKLASRPLGHSPTSLLTAAARAGAIR